MNTIPRAVALLGLFGLCAGCAVDTTEAESGGVTVDPLAQAAPIPGPGAATTHCYVRQAGAVIDPSVPARVCLAIRSTTGEWRFDPYEVTGTGLPGLPTTVSPSSRIPLWLSEVSHSAETSGAGGPISTVNRYRVSLNYLFHKVPEVQPRYTAWSDYSSQTRAVVEFEVVAQHNELTNKDVWTVVDQTIPPKLEVRFYDNNYRAGGPVRGRVPTRNATYSYVAE
jgi:hypothetical protein